ncbi:hypothetical protein E4M02_05945 [Brevundimonas sp. S30B]|uniref:DUF6894 family protein n=1 Tax=unclassified Brevundimonas TaxID=2622653 RepID=UPI00107663EE|nr:MULTISPECIES: hypothetical protein [unclassified Brevundimonas]QBX38103.1 hypothetical protein E4M01_10195 [Brevundimonas sp. MF30-B]TFW02543.1 hypothetical protein E4M02_05945 [Brevundimonas sp. S30B]
MAHFQYTVSDSRRITCVEDSAVDEAAARREALMLLSGLLRDLAITGGEGSGFVVEVHDAGGALVTRLTAGVTH